MNSTQTRLNSFIFLVVLGLGSLLTLTYDSFSRHVEWQEQLQLSYKVRLVVLSLTKAETKNLAELEGLLQELKPPVRVEAVQDVIASLKEGNGQKTAKAIEILQLNEEQFLTYATSRVAYFRQRIIYYGALVVLFSLLLLPLIGLSITRGVFKTVAALSKKMDDFQNNRYSYEFTVPNQDEVGELHAKFNVLAQTVISNMAELKSLDVAKSEFLSIASHELRTPMTSIKGSLSLLATGLAGKFSEQGQQLLQIAEQETDRLIRLINELLDLAKIEARKFSIRQDWIQLMNLITTTVQGLQGLQTSAHVQVQVEALPDIEVLADADRIQQVMTNLLSNAIKFSPPDGQVILSCQLDEKQGLVISVKDQGKGIAPEDQELIFQKFRQDTSPENPLVKGTGLGLAIAKALVEEHEGSIGVISKSGQGSTFYFTLPKWRKNTKRSPTAGQEVAA